MTNNKPWLIIICGPNGAGKTTFHDKILKNNPFFQNAFFANSDIEFARLFALPENQKFVQELQYEIKQTSENIHKKLLGKFKKTMESVSGDITERIYRRNDENKTYWHEQYSLSVHIPQEQAYILHDLTSKRDLMHRLSSSNVHERINAKAEKINWYKTYKRLINTIEVQETIYVSPLEKRLTEFESSIQRTAAKNVLHKINTAFKNRDNIIFETTGAGTMARRFTAKAKNLYHYNVCGFFPYLLHPELSVARVHHRVANGGHNVPEDVILSRYERSLFSLSKILSEVDVGIVMDNSGKKPYQPVFGQLHGYFVDFAQCPEYLQPTHSEMIAKMPKKNIKELLHLQQDIDIAKMNEEQRENLAQIVISNLLGQIR